MQLSPADLQLIKSQPQEFNLYLNIYQPETLFAARVNGSITQGERDIPFDTVSIGDISAVQNNFTLMVGSSPGGNQYGTVRVRYPSPTGSFLIVAENSHIQWANNQYLTVINYVDIDAVYPRIIQDPSNPEEVIFYKDYDIPYSNQNTVLGSFPCMGPHRATFRDPATGLAQLYWSASGTYNVNGDNLTYSWFFEGATVTGSTSATPGWRTYDHAGDFRTRLRVTSSEGAIDTSYRFVSVRDRPEAGPNRPLTQWEISSLSGSRNEGGYTARVRIWEPVDDINYLKDGALVVIFSDDYYAGTQKNLGGNAENCSEIFFVGYILKGSISYDYKQGTVEFDLGSVSEMMKLSQGFSVSCQDDAAPNTWFKIKNLTVPKAIYHYLRWHSTVLFVNDFQYLEDDRKVQYFDSDRESLYDAVAKFVETGIKGEMVCDRQGKIWAELSASAVTAAKTYYPLAMEISKNEWGSSPPSNASTNAARASLATSPTITERVFPEYSYLEYGGILYQGITGTSLPLLACAPGGTPSYKGGIEQTEGFILTSQSQLNHLVGNVFTYMNSRYPEITFSMNGAFKNLDIAPVEMEHLTIEASDTPRGISFTNAPFHITTADWQYRPADKALIQTPHFAQLQNAVSGDTIPVPPPPDGGGGGGVPGTKVPPFTGGGVFKVPPAVYAFFNHRGISHGANVDADTDAIGGNGISIAGTMAGQTGVTPIVPIRFTVGATGDYKCGGSVHYALDLNPSVLALLIYQNTTKEIFYDYTINTGANAVGGEFCVPAFTPIVSITWTGILSLNGGDFLEYVPYFYDPCTSSPSPNYLGVWQMFCYFWMEKIT